MAGFPRPPFVADRRRPVLATVLVGVGASAVVLVLATVSLAALPVPSLGLAFSVVVAIAINVTVRRRTRRDDTEATLWRWLSRASTVMTLGMVAELGLDVGVRLVTGEGRVLGGHGPPAGTALGLASVIACPALYQGLVHWNRQRTRVSDPGDWLNGLAAVITLVSVGLAALGASASPIASWPTPQLVLWLVQGSVLVVLAGTAFIVISLGGLERDARSWSVAAAFTVAALAQVVAAALAHGSPTDAEVVVGRATAASWAAAGVGVLLAAALPARVRAPRPPTSQATTIGSVAVLAAAVAIAAHNAFVGQADLRRSTLLAVAAAVIAVVRLALVVRELSHLALSRWEARTDDLTGVPNRRHLMETLRALGGRPASVVLVDLERFKEVNDRYGHAGGDEIIRVVAARLQDRVVGRGTLARLGGDEFAVVLPEATLAGAADLADDLVARIAEPFEVRDETVRMGVSIGVAHAPDASGHEDLMRRADTAMNHARRAGGGVRLYDEQADALERAERRLLADLRALLDPQRDGEDPEAAGVGRLVVHYQPMLDARTRRPVGVEALVRWQHPERGLLPPAAFVELAERHGLMAPITREVLEQSVAEVASWEGAGAEVRLSVNLSGACVERPRLVGFVRDTLARHHLPAGRLVLEVTETTAVLDDAGAAAVARSLVDLGVGVSIDDYGTGYSSLTRVLAFPAEELKLDRSFTLRLTSDDRTAALVAGTIDFAHRLGLRVVAEGVEDEATFTAVAALGCDVTQGYLHSRPLPAAEVRAWFAAQAPVTPVGA